MCQVVPPRRHCYWRRCLRQQQMRRASDKDERQQRKQEHHLSSHSEGKRNTGKKWPGTRHLTHGNTVTMLVFMRASGKPREAERKSDQICCTGAFELRRN